MKINDQGIVFKSHKTGKVEQISKSDFKEINWQRLPTNYSIRAMLNNGGIFRFMGFAESDFNKLELFIKKNFELDLIPKEMSLKGWNWGTANFIGSLLSFDVDDKTSKFFKSFFSRLFISFFLYLL